MATKFSDLAKPSKDLLGDDFTNKFTLKAKKPAGPVTVTIETEQDKTGALTSKVGTKFSVAKFNVDKGQFKPDGSFILETSLQATPQLKLSFKTTKGADLGFDYKASSIAATGVLDVKSFSKLTSSACWTTPAGLIIGADATYAINKSSITGFNYGLAYKTGPVFASVNATAKNEVSLGLLYKASPELTLASQTKHSAEKLCTVAGVGGTYKSPLLGTLKAKYGSDGVVHACLVKDIVPKVTITASGSVTPSDLSTFKPGIAISM